MKKILVIAGAFLSGVVVSSVVFWHAILRPVGKAAQMEYSQALEMKTTVALQLRLGDQARFLKDFESSLPDFVQAVHSFGDNEYTRQALGRVKAYYAATGVPIPSEISNILVSVSEKPLIGRPRYAESTLTRIGDTSPVLSASTIDGQEIDFRGKTVVLNFFAIWCSPCMQEMPRLEKDLWEPLKGKGLVVVAIGREHSESELKAFRQQKGYSFPFVADLKRDLYRRFATDAIPRCVVIGRDGRIKYQSVGFVLEAFPALVKTVEGELGQ